MSGTKKWDKEAEQILLFAMILGKEEGEKTRYNWPSVHEFMTKCGMTFSKDAISQHFTKFMLKEFRNKYLEADPAVNQNGDASSATDAAPATPKKATPAKGAATKGTPASRKRGKKAVKEEEVSGDEENGPVAKNGLPLASPTKKAKTKANKDESEVKAEEEPEVSEDAPMAEA